MVSLRSQEQPGGCASESPIAAHSIIYVLRIAATMWSLVEVTIHTTHTYDTNKHQHAQRQLCESPRDTAFSSRPKVASSVRIKVRSTLRSPLKYVAVVQCGESLMKLAESLEKNHARNETRLHMELRNGHPFSVGHNAGYSCRPRLPRVVATRSYPYSGLTPCGFENFASSSVQCECVSKRSTIQASLNSTHTSSDQPRHGRQ